MASSRATVADTSRGTRPSPPQARPAQIPATKHSRTTEALEEALCSSLRAVLDQGRHPRLADGEAAQAQRIDARLRPTIGQRARGIAQGGIADVVGDVGADHRGDSETELVQPQQQQRIGEVHQREKGENGNRASEPRSRRRGRRRGRVRGPRAPASRATVANRRDEEHAEHRRDDRDDQQRSDAVPEQLISREPDQRSDDGTEGVGRAVEPEHPTPLPHRDAQHEQGVARRPPEALADTVDAAPGQHNGPRRGERDQHLAGGRKSIAGSHQRTPRPPIGVASGDDLRRGRQPFGDPLDHPDHHHGRAQGDRQEDRQDRVEQLARCVLQEADAGQDTDVAGQQQRRAWLRHGVRRSAQAPPAVTMASVRKPASRPMSSPWATRSLRLARMAIASSAMTT